MNNKITSSLRINAAINYAAKPTFIKYIKVLTVLAQVQQANSEQRTKIKKKRIEEKSPARKSFWRIKVTKGTSTVADTTSDIDLKKTEQEKEFRCYKYNKTGHIIKDCPSDRKTAVKNTNVEVLSDDDKSKNEKP